MFGRNRQASDAEKQKALDQMRALAGQHLEEERGQAAVQGPQQPAQSGTNQQPPQPRIPQQQEPWVSQQEPPAKKSKVRIAALILIVIVILVAGGAAGYVLVLGGQIPGLNISFLTGDAFLPPANQLQDDGSSLSDETSPPADETPPLDEELPPAPSFDPGAALTTDDLVDMNLGPDIEMNGEFAVEDLALGTADTYTYTAKDCNFVLRAYASAAGSYADSAKDGFDAFKEQYSTGMFSMAGWEISSEGDWGENSFEASKDDMARAIFAKGNFLFETTGLCTQLGTQDIEDIAALVYNRIP